MAPVAISPEYSRELVELAHMLQFLLGVAVGVWLGTRYDCRSGVEAMELFMRENLPPRRTAKPSPAPSRLRRFLGGWVGGDC